ncbi:hypothetical protein CCR75_007642 [Bremia lactucae]|uniref:Transmembrane protein n=1 Tax=Bremia lactucae TaxID=4779 RepID=A0A976FMK1_BRELC|nr:hypothetical protein CCR75_007642 [Bremia lactucae]
MQDRHFDVDHGVTSFRPIKLSDSRAEMLDKSLTLSHSRKELQLPALSRMSSHELDDIDAISYSSDHEQVMTPMDSISFSQREFAFDNVLFNYRVQGSLRSGLAPIALLGSWHAGLAISAFASGATVAFVRAAYRPLLLLTMTNDYQRQYVHGTALLDWGNIFSVVLGLLSDCVPIFGTRRKAYIALGWLLCALSFASICIINIITIRSVKQSNAVFGRLLEAFSLIGSIALQLSWVAAMALIVGFGQREVLNERGGLATLFIILWQAGALTAHLAVAQFQPSLTLFNTSAAVVITSVVVLPFIFAFVQEDEQESFVTFTDHMGIASALRTGFLQLWEICHEKVTHRVLLFLLLFGVLLNAKDPSVEKALASWSGFSRINDTENPWVLVFTSAGTFVALLYAKWRLLSTAWRQLAIIGTVIMVMCALIEATLITTNTIRAKWYFAILTGLKAWPMAWLSFLTVLSATEIAHVGCEGITMGLVLSGQGLAASVRNTVAHLITNSLNTQKLINEDSLSTRARVLFAAVAYATVNLFAVAAVPWLPRSKLEAQQFRVFGGFSRRGATFIVLLYAVLLILAIITNLKML